MDADNFMDTENKVQENDMHAAGATVPAWLVFVDVETTGLDPASCGLLSIGAFHPATGAEFYIECAPRAGCVVQEKAMVVNGQDIDKARARVLGEVSAVQELFFWLHAIRAGEDRPISAPLSYVLAGKNPDFDMGWLRSRDACEELNTLFRRRTIDVHAMALAAAAMRGVDASRLGIEDIYMGLGLPIEPRPHNARAGALYAWMAFEALMRQTGSVSTQMARSAPSRDTEGTKLNLEWRFDGHKSIWRGWISGRPETTLFHIEGNDAGEIILLGAFIPDDAERNRAYKTEDEAKAAALEYLRKWVRGVCGARNTHAVCQHCGRETDTGEVICDRCERMHGGGI